MSTPPITTDSTGAGTMAAGSDPVGLYTAATVDAAPEASAGSRYINPRTRDYELDEDTNQFAQMPPVRQQVLLALMTKRGSSTAQPRFGKRSSRKIRSNTFVAEEKANVRSALAHLTREDSQLIVIERIDVQQLSTGRIGTTVVYRNLTNGEEEEASV